MIRVSCIVPVYNIEKYLPECLDSILSQTCEDIEVICIDDASTDNSREVLKKYATEDKRIRCVFNVQNQGLSACRNIGVDKAQGKYILFVDGDDLIKINAVEILLSAAEKKNTDVLGFDLIEIDELNQTTRKNARSLQNVDTMHGKEYFERCLSEDVFFVAVWTYFYKREFIVDNEIRFEEGLLHEDVLFSFYAIMAANRVARLSDKLYYYRKRTESITTNPLNMLKRVESMCFIISKLQEFSLQIADTKLESSVESFIRRQVRLLRNYYKQLDTVPIGFDKGKEYVKAILPLIQGSLYNGYFPYKLRTEDMAMLRNSKLILVYGAGVVGKAMVELLEERGIHHYRLVETVSDGEVDEIATYKGTESVVIIASQKHKDEMVANVKELGFKRIIVPVF